MDIEKKMGVRNMKNLLNLFPSPPFHLSPLFFFCILSDKSQTGTEIFVNMF
jgi:hypothetical protein